MRALLPVLLSLALAFSQSGCENNKNDISVFNGEWTPSEEGIKEVTESIFSMAEDGEEVFMILMLLTLISESVPESVVFKAEGDIGLIYFITDGKKLDPISMQFSEYTDGVHRFAIITDNEENISIDLRMTEKNSIGVSTDHFPELGSLELIRNTQQDTVANRDSQQ